MRIENMNNLDLNSEIYESQKDYFKKYYSDSFKLNQGTDIILETINTFCPGGRWLDVGGGSATLFWSLMTREIQSISCSDISIEALKILYDFVNTKSEPPQCYCDVIDMYRLSNDIFESNKKRIKEYLVFDSLHEWPRNITEEPFDFITEFGVFGLSKSRFQFRECFKYLKKALADNGVSVGANWVLSKSYSKQRQHDNSYINCNEIIQACTRANLTILRCVEVEILNDSNYERVLIWAARNKKQDY